MPAVPNSILDTTKKVLGVDSDNEDFDIDILMHINSVFSRLHQLGVGPTDGFEIEDSTALWGEYLGGNKILNNVKTFMYLQVRMYFDPPTTSYDQTAKQAQIDKLEWLLNVAVDKFLPVVNSDSVNGGAFMWTLEGENVFPVDAEEGDLGIYPPSGNIWRKY